MTTTAINNAASLASRFATGSATSAQSGQTIGTESHASHAPEFADANLPAAGEIRYTICHADKITGVSMALRGKGKARLGLDEKQQVQVIGALPDMLQVLEILTPEQQKVIIKALADNTQLQILKDSLGDVSSVPTVNFPVAGYIDAETVAKELWQAYNPDAKATRASSGLSADDVEKLYSEEILERIEAAALAKNPNIGKAQFAKAHALYMQLLTKLFAKSAINWLDEKFGEMIYKVAQTVEDDLQNPETFGARIVARLESVLKAQEERAAKLAKEAADIGDII